MSAPDWARHWVNQWRAKPVLDDYPLSAWLVHEGFDVTTLVYGELVGVLTETFETIAQLESGAGRARLEVSGDGSVVSNTTIAWARAHAIEVVGPDRRPAMARTRRPSWWRGWMRYRWHVSPEARRRKHRRKVFEERRAGASGLDAWRGTALEAHTTQSGDIDLVREKVPGASEGEKGARLPLETFIDKDVEKAALGMWRGGMAVWEALGRDEAFTESLLLPDGTDLEYVVLPVLGRGVGRVFPDGVLVYETFRRALGHLEPMSLTLPDEAEPWVLAARAAGAAAGVALY